ncbi:unnamed protein product [Spirodela intermedia]|uniref:Uncharacterized protein n=1 Tax=Spirodela intermedia TaxID=51605 RepID=A0A7I8ITR9_SPIIN|nr:unnamed protein product [Spirodela intermedia]CAA6661414.1 unnamed protein product [Spirodela intermedia]
MGSVGNLAYKAFTAGLGVATLYLTFTFGVNVYRGLSWHNAQSLKSTANSGENMPIWHQRVQA